MFYKSLDYFLIFYTFILLLIISVQEENEVQITYAGDVTPPGNYKIVVWDILTKSSIKCLFIFQKITKKNRIFNANTQSYENVDVILSFFTYEKGIILEDLSDCFVHFYSVQTNNDGEFEMKMPSNVNEKLNIHIFPLDKQMNLIPFTNEPGIILQNKMKRDKGKLLMGRKDKLFIYHFLEYEQLVRQWLDNWLIENAVPTGEEAFFIKAFFRYVTEIIVERFLKTPAIHPNQLNALKHYGTTLLDYFLTNGESNLAQKLVQIDGMPNLVKHFCQFLGYGLMKDADPSENDIKIELPAEWKIFCKKYMEKISRKISGYSEQLKSNCN